MKTISQFSNYTITGLAPWGNLKPPSAMIRHNTKRPPPADGGLDPFGGANYYSAAILSACAVCFMM